MPLSKYDPGMFLPGIIMIVVIETGGRFTPHFDYRCLTDPNAQSFMSVNIYLNNVTEKNQGVTRTLQHRTNNRSGDTSALNALGRVQPVQGTTSVFRETVWHDGQEFSHGVKYLLNTDLMFERMEELDFDNICLGLSGHAKRTRHWKYTTLCEEMT